jgi:hypothetical protein
MARRDGQCRAALSAVAWVLARRVKQCWSADGEWIVFPCLDANGATSLWLMRADGSDLRQITDQLGAVSTPDGVDVLFGFYGRLPGVTRSLILTQVTRCPMRGRIPPPAGQYGTSFSGDFGAQRQNLRKRSNMYHAAAGESGRYREQTPGLPTHRVTRVIVMNPPLKLVGFRA